MKRTWSLVRAVLHIALGVVIIACYFPFASMLARERLIRWWSRRVLALCGVSVRIKHADTPQLREQVRHLQVTLLPHTLLVLNHISWIDIYVVHAFKPARFVAKSELRSWPVVGYLCDRTGTIFIERARRRAVLQINHIVAKILHQGGFVGVFPEGTTSDGSTLLPFHSNLMQAAIDAEATLQPAALRYLKVDAEGREHATSAAAYVGDMSMLDSLKMIWQHAPIVAELELLAPIAATGRTRHELAVAARAAIARSLGFETKE